MVMQAYQLVERNYEHGRDCGMVLQVMARMVIIKHYTIPVLGETISLEATVLGLRWMQALVKDYSCILQRPDDAHLLDALEGLHEAWVVELFCGGLYMFSPPEAEYHPGHVMFVHEFDKLVDEVCALDKLLVSRFDELKKLVDRDLNYYQEKFEEVHEQFLNPPPWWYKLIS